MREHAYSGEEEAHGVEVASLGSKVQRSGLDAIACVNLCFCVDEGLAGVSKRAGR